jgi:hypothetical protein
MEDHEGGLDGKVIHQFAGFALRWVGKGATRARQAYTLNIGINSWPTITKMKAV